MPEERDAVKLIWCATDHWAPYVNKHMEAIRAKYFTHAAAKESKGLAAKQLPSMKLFSMPTAGTTLSVSASQCVSDSGCQALKLSSKAAL